MLLAHIKFTIYKHTRVNTHTPSLRIHRHNTTRVIMPKGGPSKAVVGVSVLAMLMARKSVARTPAAPTTARAEEDNEVTEGEQEEEGENKEETEREQEDSDDEVVRRQRKRKRAPNKRLFEEDSQASCDSDNDDDDEGDAVPNASDTEFINDASEDSEVSPDIRRGKRREETHKKPRMKLDTSDSESSDDDDDVLGRSSSPLSPQLPLEPRTLDMGSEVVDNEGELLPMADLTLLDRTSRTVGGLVSSDEGDEESDERDEESDEGNDGVEEEDYDEEDEHLLADDDDDDEADVDEEGARIDGVLDMRKEDPRYALSIRALWEGCILHVLTKMPNGRVKMYTVRVKAQTPPGQFTLPHNLGTCTLELAPDLSNPYGIYKGELEIAVTVSMVNAALGFGTLSFYTPDRVQHFLDLDNKQLEVGSRIRVPRVGFGGASAYLHVTRLALPRIPAKKREQMMDILSA